jgi:tripartite-type tricarboxylate transporter receptor subunit TctC
MPANNSAFAARVHEIMDSSFRSPQHTRSTESNKIPRARRKRSPAIPVRGGFVFARSCVLLLAGLAVLHPAASFAQAWPTKTVRILTSEPGGGSDLSARLIAQGMAGPLGQSVIVENRNGMVAAGILAKAQPDGHTLLLFSSSVWLAPYIQDNLPYDPAKDFAGVTLVSTSPNILIVHPGVAANSPRELIALAKAKPGELNYASTVIGGSPQLAGELFKMMAGVNIVQVPFKGAGPGVLGVIGGQVQLMFPGAGAALTHIGTGKIRALAVTSAQPSPLAPGLPTLSATLPGYESVSMVAVFVPARTPPKIVGRLNEEIVGVLKRAEARDRLFKIGIEVVGSSPQELAATMKADMTRMGKVIRDARIHEPK